MARIMTKAEMDEYDDIERGKRCPYRNPNCPTCNPPEERLLDRRLRDRAMKLMNELAPVTRRDEWWSTDGPYEIIEKHLRS